MRLETERLILRRWSGADLPALAAMHADAEVMAWLGSGPLTRAQSDAYAQACEAHFDQHGFGIWAVERRGDGALIGAAGLRHIPAPDHPMAPGVEIAWRQARESWGNGYVAEAATAALEDGFRRVGIREVLAYTASTNLRSQGVMRRIGMERAEALDFDHPALPAGDPLRPHVVFVARNSRGG